VRGHLPSARVAAEHLDASGDVRRDALTHAAHGDAGPFTVPAGGVLAPTCAVPELSHGLRPAARSIRSGGPRVLVDHAENSSASHRRIDRDDHVGVVIRWVLVEALMRTMVVEVTLVRDQHGTGVALVVDQHPVGALGADAADEPLGITVRPRRSRWGLDDLDVLGHEHGVERAGELGVSVPDQKPEGADLKGTGPPDGSVSPATRQPGM
jgi:hypothetical protein